MVAIGVNDDGYREVAGAAEGFTESSECWREFPSRPRSRGLHGVRMAGGDKASGMVGSIAEVFPEAAHRRRAACFYRNVPARVPKSGRAAVAAMPRAARSMESRAAAEGKALAVAEELEGMRPGEAARVVRAGYAETLTYTGFPREHWARIRTNNAIERLSREVRRRTRVVGTFPDGKSALVLVTARLKYVAETEWGSRRYPDVTLLEERPYRRRAYGAVGKCARILTVPLQLWAAWDSPASAWQTRLRGGARLFIALLWLAACLPVRTVRKRGAQRLDSRCAPLGNWAFMG